MALEIIPAQWMVKVDGLPIELTRAEMALLRVLDDNRERVCTDSELVAALRSTVPGLRMQISRLRRKLPPGTIRYVDRVGYTLRETPVSRDPRPQTALLKAELAEAKRNVEAWYHTPNEAEEADIDVDHVENNIRALFRDTYGDKKLRAVDYMIEELEAWSDTNQV